MSAKVAQYKALTGKDADQRWSDETLQKKIDEAKAENDALNSSEDVEGPSDVAKSGAPMSDEGKELQTEATPKAVKSKVLLDEHTLLQAKALELLIEVDEDWDDNRLRAEIQQAREGRADLQAKGAIPPAEMGNVNYDAATKKDKEPEIPVTLETDYWGGDDTKAHWPTSDDNRIKAGTSLNMRKSEATKLIEQGKARRNDPLPG
jgi:hypothetical protein